MQGRAWGRLAWVVAAAFVMAQGTPPQGEPGDAPRPVPWSDLFNENNPGISQTYFGSTRYSDGSMHLDLGGVHSRNVGCVTRGWNDDAACDVVSANIDPRFLGGGQGLFWDYGYRRVYDGQDGTARSTLIQGIVPLARNVPVERFGRLSIRNKAGAAQDIYSVTLREPLTAGQAEAIRPLMRVETDNRFFAYVIPTGLLDAAGQPVTAVSPDRRTIYVDSWVRAVRDVAGPGVLPSGDGARTVTIDVLHLIDDVYAGWVRLENDGTEYASNEEASNVNLGPTPRYSPDLDPAADRPALGGFQYGSVGGAAQGRPGGSDGASGYAFWARGGPRSGFVADNQQVSAAQGSTYGFVARSPTWGFYDAGPRANGYAFAVDPGAAGQRTTMIDRSGNIFTAQTLLAGRVVSQGGVTLGRAERGKLAQPCTPGEMVYVPGGRTRLQGAGAGTGTPAFCNDDKVWVGTTTGERVAW